MALMFLLTFVEAGTGWAAPKAKSVKGAAADPLAMKLPAIQFVPGTKTRAELLKQHEAWANRELLEPFRTRIQGKPWEKAATAFATSAVNSLNLPFEPDSVELNRLLPEAKKLAQAGCDDVLVNFLAVTLQFQKDENRDYAARDLGKIFEQIEKEPGFSTALPSLIGKFLVGMRGERRSDPQLEARVIELVGKSLSDGSYGKSEAAIFYRHQCSGPLGWFHARRPEAFRQVYEAAPFPDWAMHLLTGRVEYDIGRHSRGYDTADKVKPEEWRTMESQLALARKEFVTSWELRPQQPEAAGAMIDVVMLGGGGPNDTLRLWFDRATAAQFDYPMAYGTMLTAYRPRWGGSFAELFAFGRACAETKRYETDVPLQLYTVCVEILKDRGDWREFFRQPSVAEPLMTLTKALVNEPTRAAEKAKWTSLLAVYAWVTGDDKLAQETLATIEKLDRTAFALLDKVDVSEEVLRADAAVRASEARAEFEAGEKAYEKVDLKKAKEHFAAAAAKAPPAAQELIASRIGVIEVEEALATGEWVKLVPKPKLLEWTVQLGTWWCDIEGTMINMGEAEPGFIYHQARVGPEVEMRADFEVYNNPNSAHAFGIGIGYHWDDDKIWTLCEVIRQNKQTTAYLLNRYSPSGLPDQPVTLKAKNQIFVRASHGKVSFLLNGEKVFDEVDPGNARLGPADGRVGFGAYYISRGTRTRISNIEVRRLK